MHWMIPCVDECVHERVSPGRACNILTRRLLFKPHSRLGLILPLGPSNLGGLADGHRLLPLRLHSHLDLLLLLRARLRARRAHT